MTSTDPELIEALSDTLVGGATEAEAIAAFAQGGPAAARLAHELAAAAKGGEGTLRALPRLAHLDATDAAILAAAASEAPSTHLAVCALRAIAARGRAHAQRRSELAAGLTAPIAMLALGIVLAPLPNLALGGAYFVPVLRSLAVAALGAVALLVLVPSLLRHPTAGPVVLEIVAHAPLLGRLARERVEAEVALVLAPFADGASIDAAGLRAASAVATFGPLAAALHPARASIASLATRASDGLRLLLVTAPLGNRLDDRLTQWSARAWESSLRAQRRALVAFAWLLVVATSLPMLARGVSGGLGGAGPLKGFMDLENAEQKQLDEIMNESH